MAVDERRDGRFEDAALVVLLRTLTVETDRFTDIFGASHHMHRTDLNALTRIMDAERAGRPLRPGQLAEALHLSASSVTSVVDRLEAAGHVHRDRSGTDRRQVVLRVNEEAMTVARAFFTPLAAEFDRAWAEFGDDDREVIARFLARSTDASVAVRQRLARS